MDQNEYVEQVQIAARAIAGDLKEEERSSKSAWLMMECQKIAGDMDVIVVAGAAIQLILHASRQLSAATVENEEDVHNGMVFYADAMADLMMAMSRNAETREIHYGN